MHIEDSTAIKDIKEMREALITSIEKKEHQALNVMIAKAKENGDFIEVFASSENKYSLRPIEIAFQISDREAFNLILEGASSVGVLSKFLLYNDGIRFKAMTIFFDDENSFGAQKRKDKSYSKEQAYLDILKAAEQDVDFVRIYAEAAIASSRVGLTKAFDTIIEVATAREKLDEIADYTTSCYDPDIGSPKEVTLFKYLSLREIPEGFKKFSAVFPDADGAIEFSRDSIKITVLLGSSNGDEQAGFQLLKSSKENEALLNEIDPRKYNTLVISDESSTKAESRFSSESTNFVIGYSLAKFAVSPGINYANNYVNGMELPPISTYYMDHFKYAVSPKGIIQQSLGIMGFSSSLYSGNSLVDSWLAAKIASDSVSMYDGSFNKDITKYSADLSVYILKMIASTIINYQFILPHYNEAKIAATCAASVMPDLVSLAGSLAYQGTTALYENTVDDHSNI